MKKIQFLWFRHVKKCIFMQWVYVLHFFESRAIFKFLGWVSWLKVLFWILKIVCSNFQIIMCDETECYVTNVAKVLIFWKMWENAQR